MHQFVAGDVVEHFRKKQHYTILGRAFDAIQQQWSLIYQAHYDDAELGEKPVFVRLEAQFYDMVEYEGREVQRFTLVQTG